MNLISKVGMLLITLLLGGGYCSAQSETDGFRCADRTLSPRPNTKIHLGDVTKKAVSLPRPKPLTLATTSASYRLVKTEVVIDINSGRVVWAFVPSDQPLLQSAVSDVVCRARFVSTYDVDGAVSGFITYRFAGHSPKQSKRVRRD